MGNSYAWPWKVYQTDNTVTVSVERKGRRRRRKRGARNTQKKGAA